MCFDLRTTPARPREASYKQEDCRSLVDRMISRRTRVNATGLLSAPFALMVIFPARAIELPLNATELSTEILLAQVAPDPPSDILALDKESQQLYEGGNYKKALALLERVNFWANGNLPRNSPFRARTQHRMGILLSAVGRRQESLSPTEEAVRIRREISKSNPSYLDDLAWSLFYLGIRYSELGLPQKGLAPTQEAVLIRRDLAKQNQGSEAGLALALNNLGYRYRELGRFEEALAPTEESVRIQRDLAQSNPASKSDLADALTNLGLSYWKLGRKQEALGPTEEEVRIRRELAKQNPESLNDLAAALGNLGVRYGESGRLHDAISPSEEGVQLYRELAKTNPTYLWNLAAALTNLGIRYYNLDPIQKNPLGPTEEAVRLYHQLLASNPSVRSELAAASYNLGVYYEYTEGPHFGLAPAEEAVRLYRDLARSNPSFLNRLSLALAGVAAIQVKIGHAEIAKSAYQESISTIRPLVASNPAFQEDLQRLLNNLADLNRSEGISNGSLRVVEASDSGYLPNNDPIAGVKRAVVRLWPTFRGMRAGVGLLGTGFVVRRKGDRAWIATALHVVKDPENNSLATKVEAELFTGPLPAGLVAPRLQVILSSYASLPENGDEPILLELRGLPPDIKPLPLATLPAQGALMVVGHPSNQGPWTVVTYPLLKTTESALLLDGGLDSGASGSPVLSATHEVVGVVYDSPQVSTSRPIPQVWAFPTRTLQVKMMR